MNAVRTVLAKPLGIYIFIVPLFLLEVFLEPFYNVTHALVDDWFNFFSSLCLFFFGFVLISVKDTYWKVVDRVKTKALIIGVIAFAAQAILWNYQGGVARHVTEAFFKVLNIWSWIIVLFGFAQKYLNHKSQVLTYCNEAVYPFYILHQTVTVAIGFYIMNLNWSFGPKFILLSVGTFFISWLLYEFIIRRVKILRPFFGLKNKKIKESIPIHQELETV